MHKSNIQNRALFFAFSFVISALLGLILAFLWSAINNYSEPDKSLALIILPLIISPTILIFSNVAYFSHFNTSYDNFLALLIGVPGILMEYFFLNFKSIYFSIAAGIIAFFFGHFLGIKLKINNHKHNEI